MPQTIYRYVDPYDQWILDSSGNLLGIRIAGRSAPIADYLLTTETLDEELGSWDDLNFSATGINPTGAAGAATRDQDTGMIVFSGTADNVLVGTAQMKHRWVEGSAVRPHLHLRFPTAAVANTRWKFEYDMADVNGDFANAYGTYTTLATITVANPNNAKKSVIAEFGLLDMTGKTLSAQVPWKLTRLASSDAADNHAADVILTDVDFHFQSDRSNGSRTEFMK